MPLVDAIIAYDTAINNEVDSLEVLAPTSLTTRTGYGKPKITHFAAFTSTDDVSRVYCVPSGYNDAAGFAAPLVTKYSATTGFDLAAAKLPIPIEVPENTKLNIYAKSETAADTVVFAWMLLEYPASGPSNFHPVKTTGGLVERAWEHGAALVSNTIADSTDITDLIAGRKYQLAGVGHAEVNGATAGIVGPAFFGLSPNHTDGFNFLIPLCNSAVYTGASVGFVDFRKADIKSPIIPGGQPLKTRCVGYTAEQPQAIIQLVTDKVFA